MRFHFYHLWVADNVWAHKSLCDACVEHDYELKLLFGERLGYWTQSVHVSPNFGQTL